MFPFWVPPQPCWKRNRTIPYYHGAAPASLPFYYGAAPTWIPTMLAGGLPRPAEPIIVPQPNDVKLGRGGDYHEHPGNIQLRELALGMGEAYATATKREKTRLSRILVDQIHALNPPGRFLERKGKESPWEAVTDDEARKRASQELRIAAHAAPPKEALLLDDPFEDFLLNAPIGGFDPDESSISSGSLESLHFGGAEHGDVPPGGEEASKRYAILDKAKKAMANFTGKGEYRFGVITKKALANFTGKAEYHFGDITKKVCGDLFGKCQTPADVMKEPRVSWDFNTDSDSSVLRVRLGSYDSDSSSVLKLRLGSWELSVKTSGRHVADDNQTSTPDEYDGAAIEVALLALFNYECYNGLEHGTASFEDLMSSSEGIEEWAARVVQDQEPPEQQRPNYTLVSVSDPLLEGNTQQEGVDVSMEPPDGMRFRFGSLDSGMLDDMGAMDVEEVPGEVKFVSPNVEEVPGEEVQFVFPTNGY